MGNLASPLVGIMSDRLGSRRPLMVAGAATVTLAVAGMLLSVLGVFGPRSTFSFILFSLSYLMMQSGCTMLSVSFSGLIADFGKRLPSKVGTISGVWSLFQLTGATAGYLLSGLICPVQLNDHQFYWILAVLVVLANFGLLRLPPELLVVHKTTVVTTATGTDMDTDTSTDGSDGITPLSLWSQWWSSHEYGAWRCVCLARLVFFFGLGTFQSLALYFMEDQTDAGSHATQVLTYVSLISLGCSLLTVWPAGKLSDRWGPAVIAAFGTVVMSAVLFVLPLLKTTTMMMLIIPLYGVAQQGYNVGDLGLVIQSIPNDDTKARDMGGWSACQALGISMGSIYAGAVISFFHDTLVVGMAPSSSSSSNTVARRTPYLHLGYLLVFLPAAVFMCISVVLVLRARKRIGTNDGVGNKLSAVQVETNADEIVVVV